MIFARKICSRIFGGHVPSALAPVSPAYMRTGVDLWHEFLDCVLWAYVL